MTAKKYRVLVGINWPDGQGGERRAEPGDILTVADLKGANVAWYLQVGALEAVKEAADGI
jgi:hypothetical protein